jgi:crotonobetainyl-CoA:carnitine CoA-transferase CaiB-like acyl-CoA transferase
MTVPLALEGIRVLDLSQYEPGAFCTMILGDLGADIVKVENPAKDDSWRAKVGDPFGSNAVESTRAFDTLNRNKKSIALNLKTTEGRQIFYKLSQKADVILESFRPGVTKRINIDYDTIRQIAPRLIYCSLSGYGQNGPYMNFVGHDINYLAMAGLLGLIGKKDGPPILPPTTILGDFAGGALHAAVGILAALVTRERTGKGQYLSVAMTDGVLALLSWEASRYLSTGIVPKRGEMKWTGMLPYYNVYETKDRKYITIACTESHFWEPLCKILGHKKLIPYQHVTEKRLEIAQIFKDTFLTKTRDEWFNLLATEGIPIAKVYDFEEVFNDPQLIHEQMFVDLGSVGYPNIKQIGIPIKLATTPGSIRSIAPLQGQHTRQILAEIGYDELEIEKLYNEGIIACAR